MRWVGDERGEGKVCVGEVKERKGVCEKGRLEMFVRDEREGKGGCV